MTADSVRQSGAHQSGDIEPTREMVRAGVRALERCRDACSDAETAEEVYIAMARHLASSRPMIEAGVDFCRREYEWTDRRLSEATREDLRKILAVCLSAE
jgi:hypothetical protein